MPDSSAQGAVTALAAAVHALRPLSQALGVPLRLRLPAADPRGPLIVAIGTAQGVPLAIDPDATAADLTVFERVAQQWLAPALGAPGLDDPAVPDLARGPRTAAAVAATSFERFRIAPDAVARDGARLPVYAVGDPAAPPVVLASACGMPAQLCDRWLAALARDHYVVTWESRGLFGDVPDFDQLEWDTAAQAADVLAVMDHLGIPRAHLMGFCGGSVIGLYAAATEPDRIVSLSLWHGAYELGPRSPKLDHHRHIQALMAMAGESRPAAAVVHSVFLKSMLTGDPLDREHLVLYPFATPDLFYRYCKVNGTITDIDVTPLLDKVMQPTLVVTSEDDTTASPQGSAYVARQLPHATLRVEPHGDHISLFANGDRLAGIALDFMRDAPAPVP